MQVKYGKEKWNKNQEFYVQYKNKSKINSDVNLRERYNCMLEVLLTRYVIPLLMLSKKYINFISTFQG